MYNGCALPDHLKGVLHNDWPWPLSKLERSINAFGPRCPIESPKYRRWPPYLIKGYGVSRWESTGATSIIHIPEFDNKKVNSGIYGLTWDAIELNPANENYMKEIKVKLHGDGEHSPSALQRFSKRGWMKLSPWYVAQWWKIKDMGKGKEDYYLFHRQGMRPDHQDKYYNWGPMLGLKMD